MLLSLCFKEFSRACWHVIVIPDLEKLRQKDDCGIKVT